MSTACTCRDCRPVLAELHKVRFIIGTGLEYPQLRDEIYCQIIKQITKNPCVYSRSKGNFFTIQHMTNSLSKF